MALSKQLQLIVGTHFTSAVERLGWRHFRVLHVKRDGKKWAAELAASCDDQKRLTVFTDELLDASQWTRGLTLLRELKK